MPRGVRLGYAKRQAVAECYRKWVALGLPVRNGGGKGTRTVTVLQMVQRKFPGIPGRTVWDCLRPQKGDYKHARKE